MKNETVYKAILTVVVLLVSAIVAVILIGSMREHKKMTDQKWAIAQGQPLPVSTVDAEFRQLQAMVGAECIGKETHRIAISSVAGSKVVEINVKPGDRVNKGDILFRFADATLKKTLENALNGQRAAREQTDYMESYLDDLKGLEQKKLLPIVDMLRAREDIAQARRVLRQTTEDIILLQERLQETVITAPVGGVISELNIEPGTLPRSSQDLAYIDQINPLTLVCEFSEDAVARIKAHDNATVSFVATPGVEIDVTFDRLLPGKVPPGQTDNNQTVSALFTLPNPEHSYIVGMHAIIRLTQSIEGVSIPSIAIINQAGDEADVFVVNKQNEAELRTIEVGSYAGGYIKVLNGLQTGEKVVVAGQMYLQHGDSVRDNRESSNTAGEQ